MGVRKQLHRHGTIETVVGAHDNCIGSSRDSEHLQQTMTEAALTETRYDAGDGGGVGIL